MKRTPLFATHQKLGGKLIEFGGWEMPVQYSSITDEHLTVRKAAGLFDISHMGEISVSGPAAETFLNQTLTNDIRKLAVGQGQYTLMCNERGCVVDDLYAYRLGETDYLLIINASRINADLAWLDKQLAASGSRANGAVCSPGFSLSGNATLRDISDVTAALALQGPTVVQFIGRIFPDASVSGTRVSNVTELQKNQVGAWFWRLEGKHHQVWVARTGYTGEDGFEIIAPAEAIESIWQAVLAAGATHGLKPAGLGARDTLRTEVCYPLYGHELDETTTPIEAGLGFFVALEKGEFTGRSVLAEQKASGTSKKLVAFKMTEKSPPPRPQYPIWSSGPGAAKIGEVVSGTQSPSLGIGIGMGYIPSEAAKIQTPIQIEIRARLAAAVVVPKPFYRRTP